ncbi:MAG: beta-ketoacyl synthase chain length factor [Bacteroidales bacterium]|nr:beta-ketoacyl synthase chain length factor [Bacteroidales bacterium]
MALYIKAAQAISPQDTFLKSGLFEVVNSYDSVFECVLPSFKKYFSPIESRRSNKAIKMGYSCALETLAEANLESPDAIITGSGLGGVSDTEKLLNTMLLTQEGTLSPTPFIQSTHNIIGAMVAQNKKCHNYNVIYAHKTASFEHALMDALMLEAEGSAKEILTGGYDELTSENYNLKKLAGKYKKESCTTSDILHSNSDGSIAGEGSAFFVLSNENSENKVQVVDVATLSFENEIGNIENWITSFLSQNKLEIGDINNVMLGINGDAEGDTCYYSLMKSYFKYCNHLYYKHLCGEYDTASTFAVWMSNHILRNKSIPEFAVIKRNNSNINNILIYNQERGSNHALILLRTNS